MSGLCFGARAEGTPAMQNADSLQRVVDDLSSQLEQQNDIERDRKIWKNRAKYFNLGYVRSTLTDAEDAELRNDWGASISWGRTYYLHRKPLFGMLKFGLDWSWLDLNYAKYTIDWYDNDNSGIDPGYDYLDDGYEDEESYSKNMHHAEIGMSFGPSVTLNPVGHLKISAYFRVTPSFSAIYMEDFGSSYATFFNAGAAISYKAISVGVESRWGEGKYKNFIGTDFDEETGEELPAPKLKYKTNSLRVYLSFRF